MASRVQHHPRKTERLSTSQFVLRGSHGPRVDSLIEGGEIDQIARVRDQQLATEDARSLAEAFHLGRIDGLFLPAVVVLGKDLHGLDAELLGAGQPLRNSTRHRHVRPQKGGRMAFHAPSGTTLSTGSPGRRAHPL